jgi:hypothetical protein
LLRGFSCPSAEVHFAIRAGWLRAAVLGANDGIISTASLVVGRLIRSFVRWQRMTAPIDLTH